MKKLLVFLFVLILAANSWGESLDDWGGCRYPTPYYDQYKQVAKIPYLVLLDNRTNKYAYFDNNNFAPISIVNIEIQLEPTWRPLHIQTGNNSAVFFFKTADLEVVDANFIEDGKPIPLIGDLKRGYCQIFDADHPGELLAKFHIEDFYLNQERHGDRFAIDAEIYTDICQDLSTGSTFECSPVIVKSIKRINTESVCFVKDKEETPYVAIIKIFRYICVCDDGDTFNILGFANCEEIYDSKEAAQFFGDRDRLKNSEQYLESNLRLADSTGCDCSQSYALFDSFWNTRCRDIAEVVEETKTVCYFPDWAGIYYLIKENGELPAINNILPTGDYGPYGKCVGPLQANPLP